MFVAVVSGFGLAIAAPFLFRITRHSTGCFIALLPLSLFIYFCLFINKVARGETFGFSYPWVPSLRVDLSFYLDGLSLLFAMIITGIGVLVVVYANTYLKGNHDLARFYSYILTFMSSMLGLVLADNLITLFVFWELTGLSSYMLIGFNHDQESAQSAALQALLVTGLGGLALLAGFLLLGQSVGSFDLTVLIQKGDIVRSHPLYVPIFLLILAGAFTKSAQFPFHFWLPNAMEAPTPASAYLHSATMVKAGVYLLARFSPIMGGTVLWQTTIVLFGAVTMLVGAVLAIRQRDLKRVLAYTTVSVLGVLVFLLGLGTKAALEAAITYLIIHCLYKAALFLVAGIVDHEAGTRDVKQLHGLAYVMPLTAGAAVLAAFSMAGLPPLFGFIGKELFYRATLEAPLAASLLTVAALLTNVLLVVSAGIVGIGPFFGKKGVTPKKGHESHVSLWIGPVLLAGFGIVIGLLPNPLAASVVSPAVAAVLGGPIVVRLGLLHGLTLQLLFSGITFVFGVLAYIRRDILQRAISRVDFGVGWGAARLYDLALDAMKGFSHFQTRIVQCGHLHVYLLIIVLTTIGLVGFSLRNEWGLVDLSGWSDMRFQEMVISVVILAAILVAVRASSRLTAVVALGVVGYSMVFIYILFGAPDLAMTQFSIDTLTVILLVLVLYRLPRYVKYSNTMDRIRDGVPALAAGALITVLVLAALALPGTSRLAHYFAENTYELAKGRNIVNVILVDFRAMDTMGEITVLAVAAIGVYSLLKLRLGEDGRKGKGRGSMTSLILSTAMTYLLPLLLLLSVYLLLHGHNLPGGGFVGGLVAAAAFGLYMIAHGVEKARRLLYLNPITLIASGLFVALVSGFVSIFFDRPFLTGQWSELKIPVLGKVGTPLLFDTGVYMVVIGITLMIIFSLAED